MVALGVLGLWPALAVGLFCSVIAWDRLTAQYWSNEDIPGAIYLLIVLGYVLMLWQWIAVLAGWRTLLAARPLWAVSSIYFTVAPALIIYENYTFLTDGEDAPDKWARVAVVLFLPVLFLMLTIPLWLKTPVGTAKEIVNSVADGDAD